MRFSVLYKIYAFIRDKYRNARSDPRIFRRRRSAKFGSIFPKSRYTMALGFISIPTETSLIPASRKTER